jgi:hypothetical protein
MQLVPLRFGTQLVPRAWAVLRRFQSARAWPKVGTSSAAAHASPSTSAARSTPAVSTHWLESLGVFAAAYGTFLLTGDDEEFAKLGRPLPVAVGLCRLNQVDP